MDVWQRNLAICWLGSFMTVAGMTLVLPFLPLYLEDLGLTDVTAVEQWSGLAFGVTTLLAAIVSPLWGRLADQYGRKLMLLRASLGMAIVTAAMGFCTHPWHLVALRFLMGAVSGYISAATTLVATQTPKERVGWSMGVLSTGHMAGGLIGPVLGGLMAETMGLRHVFWVTGGVLFLTFLLTLGFLVETFQPEQKQAFSGREVWDALPSRRLLVAMFVASFMLNFASLTIEPVITVYVKQLLVGNGHVALMAGLVVSAMGVANLLAAPRLGRLSDRIGPRTVLVGSLIASAVVMVPQAYVRNAWELTAWRFAMGLASGGLLPAVNAVVRQLAPDRVAGRVFGYNQSALYLGTTLGPMAGGLVAAQAGIPGVFLLTAVLLAANACWIWFQPWHEVG
jgi:MFS family permease